MELIHKKAIICNNGKEGVDILALQFHSQMNDDNDNLFIKKWLTIGYKNFQKFLSLSYLFLSNPNNFLI